MQIWHFDCLFQFETNTGFEKYKIARVNFAAQWKWSDESKSLNSNLVFLEDRWSWIWWKSAMQVHGIRLSQRRWTEENEVSFSLFPGKFGDDVDPDEFFEDVAAFVLKMNLEYLERSFNFHFLQLLVLKEICQWSLRLFLLNPVSVDLRSVFHLWFDPWTIFNGFWMVNLREADGKGKRKLQRESWLWSSSEQRWCKSDAIQHADRWNELFRFVVDFIVFWRWLHRAPCFQVWYSCRNCYQVRRGGNYWFWNYLLSAILHFLLDQKGLWANLKFVS